MHKIIHTLYEIGAVQFGEFTLKSGEISSIYINLRKIISYPDLLRAISELMWNKIKSSSFDLVCGVPYTALPIATCLSLSQNMPMIMRRKESKNYGTKQMIEGVFARDQTCIIIEDIITTGGSILETAQDLENAGLRIHDVIALIEREAKGRKNLEKKYRVHTLFTLQDILNTLLHSSLINTQEETIIKQFLLAKSA